MSAPNLTSQKIEICITEAQKEVLRKKHQKERPDLSFDDFFNQAIQQAVVKMARQKKS